tara:strand:- start:1222 stop:1473 length:252 start_codon:yes stop_codon:yes gene_type:complete
MIIALSILLTLSIIISLFIIRNLLLKNERLLDFIAIQSDAINICDSKLKEIDSKGMFEADDSIGWFFKAVKDIQASLNEFTLK